MPKSRKRRPKKRRKVGAGRKPEIASRPQKLRDAQLVMPFVMAADEAERRGDAVGALDEMSRLPEGIVEEPFWRPGRVRRLHQLAVLGPVLPRWATSRWILEQALQTLDEEQGRQRFRGALDAAMKVRGEAHARHDHAGAKIADHDWVFRQSKLYDLGGLRRFLDAFATPELLAGADHIEDWATSPMGGFRYLGRDSSMILWHDRATGDVVTTANIGSAVLLEPGEHVIGRLVPIETGVMFETAPLWVPERVARRVADDPATWVEALTDARKAGEAIPMDGHFELLTDVPPLVWQLALLPQTSWADNPSPSVTGGELARYVLDVADRDLTRMEDEQWADESAGWLDEDEGEPVDGWACIGAALLDPAALHGLPAVVGPADRVLVSTLADLLAEPAGAVCRELVAELDDVA